MDLIKQIEKNPLVLEQEPLLRALLSDLFQNDQAKVNLLLTAYRIGIVKLMEKGLPLPAPEKNRMMKVLVDEYSIVDKRAAWAIDTWISAVTPTAIENLFALRIAREQEALLAIEAETMAKTETASEEDLTDDGELLTREDI